MRYTPLNTDVKQIKKTQVVLQTFQFSLLSLFMQLRTMLTRLPRQEHIISLQNFLKRNY